MARSPERPPSPCRVPPLYLLLLLLATEVGVSGNLMLGGTKVMILPLTLRAANSTLRHPTEGDHFGRRRLRHLQGSDDRKQSARMRLYDDLLTNGYYTTRLSIGTPPQEFSLIVDSGSTVTYVPCSTCEQCGKHQELRSIFILPSSRVIDLSSWLLGNISHPRHLPPGEQDPRFQPDKSRTYRPVKCNPDCTCDDEKNQCTYKIQYAEGSSSSGVLGEDLISFGNESELVPQGAVFGCGNLETGDLYTQRADGIMGLGRGRLSVMDQLVEKEVISDSFSLCYGGMGIGGGAMVLGGISPPPEMVFSYSDPNRSPYYNIDLKGIHIAGKNLALDAMVFNRKYGTVLDSGTTYAYLPSAAFESFRDAVMKHVNSLKQIPGPDPSYKDICFSGAGSNASHLSETFPAVDMAFGNGQKLSLSPENYLFEHTKVHGAYCLGIFDNGNDSTTLLGGIIVRNTLVMYDRANQKVGFWKTNCSQLSEKFRFGDSSLLTPPPAPSAPSSGNSSMAPQPALSPSGSPDILAGEWNVALITFDIHVSMNKSELVPHISELTEYIARDLEVNASQVSVISLESESNGSLIRWSISPSGSADFISHDAAVGIISRLIGHRVRLPESFGTYRLVDWKVERPSERSKNMLLRSKADRPLYVSGGSWLRSVARSSLLLLLLYQYM